MAYTINNGTLIISGSENTSLVDVANDANISEVTVITSNSTQIVSVSAPVVIQAGATLLMPEGFIYTLDEVIDVGEVDGLDQESFGTLLVGEDHGDNNVIKTIVTTNEVTSASHRPQESFFNPRGSAFIGIYASLLKGVGSIGTMAASMSDATFDVKDSTIINTGSTDQQLRVLTASFSAVNCNFSGITAFLGRAPVKFEGCILSDIAEGALTANWGSDASHVNIILEGLKVERNNGDFYLLATNENTAPKGAVLKIINGDSDTDNYPIRPRNNRWDSNRTVGTILLSADLDVSVTDASSNDLNFSVYMEDTYTGDETESEISDDAEDEGGNPVKHFWAEQQVIESHDNAGSFSGEITKAVFSKPLSKIASADPVEWQVRLPINGEVRSYGYVPKTFQLSGNITGAASVGLTLDVDTEITDDVDTVDARKNILNSEHLYDKSTRYKQNNPVINGLGNELLSKVGDTITINSSLVIDSEAEESITLPNDVLTICSSGYTGNLVVNGNLTTNVSITGSVESSGLVTLENGATISGGFTDTTRDSLVTVSGVDLTGDNVLEVSTNQGLSYQVMDENRYPYLADPLASVQFRYTSPGVDGLPPSVSTGFYSLAAEGLDNVFTEFSNDTQQIIDSQTTVIRELITDVPTQILDDIPTRVDESPLVRTIAMNTQPNT